MRDIKERLSAAPINMKRETSGARSEGIMRVIGRLRSVLFIGLAAFAIGFTRSNSQSSPSGKSDAQKAFELLQTLAGDWKGQSPDAPVRVSLRVTSGGSALLQEMTPEGRVDDPRNGDNDPITIIYVEGDRLFLIMYCDAFKNRPRMVGRLSPDGRTVDFEFLDVSGGARQGYMDHAIFTIVDANHQTEDWGVLTSGGRHVHSRVGLVRV